MGMAIVIALLGLQAAANYRLARSVLYPPFVFAMIWLLVLAVYAAGIVFVYPLHARTLVMIGAGSVIFSVMGLMAWLLPAPLLNIRLRIGNRLDGGTGSSLVKYALILFFAGAAIFTAASIFRNGLLGSGGTMALADARGSAVAESQGGERSTPGWTAYVPVWCTCTATLFLLERRDRLFWTIAALALVTAVLTTGRGPVLQVFTLLLTVELMRSGRTGLGAALRLVRLPGAAFLLLYVVLIFTNKDTSTLGGSMAAIITYFVVGYIVSPTAALDFVLEHARDYAAEPNRTFKFPLSAGSALHLWPYTPPPFLDRFIYVPIPTNVYTGYKFYFTDFGFAGALVSVAMIAGLECLLYRKALTGSVLGRYLFAYTMFPLVMFVFDDAFAATGQMLNALLFGCIYLWLRTTVRVLPGRGPRAMAFPRIGLRLLPRRRLSAE